MITTKQRAALRAMANSIEPIFQIGKNEIGPELITEIYNALEARELIKLRVLETSPVSSREAADEIAEKTHSDVVQVIGTRFVLYRESRDNKQIRLVK